MLTRCLHLLLLLVDSAATRPCASPFQVPSQHHSLCRLQFSSLYLWIFIHLVVSAATTLNADTFQVLTPFLQCPAPLLTVDCTCISSPSSSGPDTQQRQTLHCCRNGHPQHPESPSWEVSPWRHQGHGYPCMSRKQLFTDSHQSEDTNMQPLKKSQLSYTDLLVENRAWVWSSIKSCPEDCKQCDGINEILHDTPHYLDKYWTVRPTERSPEKNWHHVYPSLCQQTAGKPHLLAKELVWRLFTIEQHYGNRFHTLDESITSKICFIVMYETSCGIDYWWKKCVLFINSSIWRLFNDKFRKYEHLLNHTCAPKETTTSVPNTCTAILPYRF